MHHRKPNGIASKRLKAMKVIHNSTEMHSELGQSRNYDAAERVFAPNDCQNVLPEEPDHHSVIVTDK